MVQENGSHKSGHFERCINVELQEARDFISDASSINSYGQASMISKQCQQEEEWGIIVRGIIRNDDTTTYR